MKNKKGYWIVLLTIAALLLDLVGRVLADQFVLPLWCDSIGTFLIAYLGGPVCGAVVGFSNNIIYGIFVDRQTVYCIVDDWHSDVCSRLCGDILRFQTYNRIAGIYG